MSERTNWYVRQNKDLRAELEALKTRLAEAENQADMWKAEWEEQSRRLREALGAQRQEGEA
jgi:cell division septum initiation protein DivIVA